MAKGSCLCGNVKYEYQGEPEKKSACHCTSCRKVSGVDHAVDFFLKDDKFKLTAGQPAKFSRKGDSGKPIHYLCCPDCHTHLWMEMEAMQGMKLLKMGTIDDEDVLKNGKPENEIFVEQRLPWVPQYEGAGQREGM